MLRRTISRLITTETYGGSCICEKLDNFGLGDKIVVEEGDAIPGRQEMEPHVHFHFAPVVENDSVMERGDSCGFVQGNGDPFFHLKVSHLQCLCVLRYPPTACYSGHVDHGINATSHPRDFPYLLPYHAGHFPAEAFMQAGSGVLLSSSHTVWRTFCFVT